MDFSGACSQFHKIGGATRPFSSLGVHDILSLQRVIPYYNTEVFVHEHY